MDFACGTQEGEKKFLLGLIIILFFQTLLGFAGYSATLKTTTIFKYIGRHGAISFTKM